MSISANTSTTPGNVKPEDWIHILSKDAAKNFPGFAAAMAKVKEEAPDYKKEETPEPKKEETPEPEKEEAPKPEKEEAPKPEVPDSDPKDMSELVKGFYCLFAGQPMDDKTSESIDGLIGGFGKIAEQFSTAAGDITTTLQEMTETAETMASDIEPATEEQKDKIVNNFVETMFSKMSPAGPPADPKAVKLGEIIVDILTESNTAKSKTPSSDPSTSDPSTSDPSTSDPSTSDPSTSDPSTSDPSTSPDVLNLFGKTWVKIPNKTLEEIEESKRQAHAYATDNTEKLTDLFNSLFGIPKTTTESSPETETSNSDRGFHEIVGMFGSMFKGAMTGNYSNASSQVIEIMTRIFTTEDKYTIDYCKIVSYFIKALDEVTVDKNEVMQVINLGSKVHRIIVGGEFMSALMLFSDFSDPMVYKVMTRYSELFVEDPPIIFL